MGKAMSKTDYSLGDVYRLVFEDGGAKNVYEVARLFPALVASLQEDKEAVLLTFAGDKKAHTAEKALRETLGVADEGADEPEKPEVPEDEPPGETPAKVKSKQKPAKAEQTKLEAPAKPAKEKSKQAKAEDDLDSLLSELEDADPDAGKDDDGGAGDEEE